MSKMKKSKIEKFLTVAIFILYTHTNFYPDPIKTPICKKNFFEIFDLGDSFWWRSWILLYENPPRSRKNQKITNFEKL